MVATSSTDSERSTSWSLPAWMWTNLLLLSILFSPFRQRHKRKEPAVHYRLDRSSSFAPPSMPNSLSQQITECWSFQRFLWHPKRHRDQYRIFWSKLEKWREFYEFKFGSPLPWHLNLTALTFASFYTRSTTSCTHAATQFLKINVTITVLIECRKNAVQRVKRNRWRYQWS